MATAFLQAESATAELERFMPAISEVLHAERARIVLGPSKEPPPGESPLELTAGSRRLGTLYLREGAGSSLAIRRRFLPALASLVAVAVDRERLAREAVEAEALRRSDTIKTAVLQAVSHDLRSPLTAIKVAADEPCESGARARRRRTAQNCSRRCRSRSIVSSVSSGTCSTSRASRPVRRSRTASSGRSTSSRTGARAARRGGAQRVELDLAGGGRLRRGRRRPDRARARQPARERAQVLAPPTSRSTSRVTTHAQRRPRARRRPRTRHPGAELERIFEPFHRVCGGDERGGTGLGLAIAKGFAEANGGRVWAESRRGRVPRSCSRSRSSRPRSGRGMSEPARSSSSTTSRRSCARSRRRCGARATRSRPAATGRGGAGEGGRAAARMRSSSTSSCPTAAASRSAASCELVEGADPHPLGRRRGGREGRGARRRRRRLRDEAVRDRRAARAPARGAPARRAARGAD